MFDLYQVMKENNRELERQLQDVWLYMDGNPQTVHEKAYWVLQELLDNEDAGIRLKAAELLLNRKRPSRLLKSHFR